MVGLLVLAFAGQARSQTSQSPVKQMSLQPQIEIAGSGITTLDIGREGLFGHSGLGSTSQINFSDSALVFGATQRLYHGGLGSFSLGGLTIDQGNTGHGQQVFLHQAFLDFQELRYEAYLGRTNSPTTQLVTFPTLREDDLTDFTTVLNPFSNGENIEEHRYGNVAAVVVNQGLHHFENIHVQHLIDSAGVGDGDTALNSAGVTYQYEGNPALMSIERLPSFGIGFENRALKSSAGGSSNVIYGGGTLNLQPSMVNKLDLRVLGQIAFGNDTRVLIAPNDTYRADQQSLAVSVRKLYSPFGKAASQWAVTAGWKRFSKVSGANTFGVALSYAKSLGQGFDFVSQLGYDRRTDAVASAFGGRRDGTTFQVGLVFNLGSTFNESVGPRRSPTNLLHQYIPN